MLGKVDEILSICSLYRAEDGGDDGVCLVDLDGLADVGASEDFLDDGEVVQSRLLDCGTLQLDRLEERDRVDAAGAGRLPGDARQGCLGGLVSPLECDAVAGMVSRGTEGVAICDLIEEQHEPIGGKILLRQMLFDLGDFAGYFFSGYREMLDGGEPEGFQPVETCREGVLLVSVGGDQRERMELDGPLVEDGSIEGTHRPACEVAGILVFGAVVLSRVDAVELGVCHQGLASDHEFSGKRDSLGNACELAGLDGDILAYAAVAAGHRLGELAVSVGEDDSRAVELVGQAPPALAEPGGEFIAGLGLGKGEHRGGMLDLRQGGRGYGGAYVLGDGVGADVSGGLFEGYELVVEGIVFVVGHDLDVAVVVGIGCFFEDFLELVDAGAGVSVVRHVLFSLFSFSLSLQ